MREGSALLQGIASCGHCGRRLMTHYRGRNSTPGYHCAGKDIVDGRGQYCLTIGGLAIEQAASQRLSRSRFSGGRRSHHALLSNNSKQNHDAGLVAVAVGSGADALLRPNGPNAATGPWSRKTG